MNTSKYTWCTCTNLDPLVPQIADPLVHLIADRWNAYVLEWISSEDPIPILTKSPRGQRSVPCSVKSAEMVPIYKLGVHFKDFGSLRV